MTYGAFPIRGVGFLIMVVYFFNVALNPMSFHVIQSFDLIMHEAGHTLSMFFGHFLYVAGGSLFQVFVPAFCVWYFFMREEYLSAASLMLWVGESIISVSIYANDALTRELPLLGDDPSSHDWFYLLDTTGLLAYTAPIAGVIQGCGWAVLCIGTVWGVSLLYNEWEQRSSMSTLPQ